MISKNFIRVTFSFTNINDLLNDGGGTSVGTNEIEKQIIGLILIDLAITMKQVATKLQLSNRQVERVFSKLKKKGLIERIELLKVVIGK